MNSRRVVAVIHAPVYGGLHNLAALLRAPLLDRGWDMEVVLPLEAAAAAARLRGDGVGVTLLPLRRLRRSFSPSLHIDYTRSLSTEAATLATHLVSAGADIVQSNGLLHQHAALAARRARCAYVCQLNSTFAPAGLRAVARLATARAAAVMVEGEGVRRAHPGIDAQRDRAVTFYPGVDSSLFSPDPRVGATSRARLGIPGSAVVFGTVGNFTRQKGHDLLIDASVSILSANAAAWLVVIGARVESNAAWYEQNVEQRLRALPPDVRERIRFVEPGARVPEWLRALDVFVLTSRAEGVATATIEAMAVGLPVVACDVGSVREVVEHESSGLVVPRTDAALVGACLRLLVDGALRSSMGSRGRDLAATRFTPAACADAHAAAYTAALRGASRRSSRSRARRLGLGTGVGPKH